MSVNNLEGKSSAEIGVIIDELEKELGLALISYADVEQEKLLLQRKILEMSVTKKDLEIALSKAGHNLKQKNIELKLARSSFWKCKNQGL